MLDGRPLTAIIPVRGGSKRLPGKNTRKLGNDTLLERAIKLARKTPRIDRTVVSTDDPDMYACAQTYGVAMSALRPARLATDDATTIAVVNHLIEESNIRDGYLLLLQATSPLRTQADLEDLLDLFEAASDADAIISLCRHEGPHPEKLQTIVDGRVVSYMGADSHRPEQHLAEVYALNGAFYLVDLTVYKEQQTFFPNRTMAYLMPPERSANLDTETDWKILEAMLAQGHWILTEYE